MEVSSSSQGSKFMLTTLYANFFAMQAKQVTPHQSEGSRKLLFTKTGRKTFKAFLIIGLNPVNCENPLRKFLFKEKITIFPSRLVINIYITIKLVIGDFNKGSGCTSK